MAITSISLYEVLGIQMGATGQEIKAAYRRLARSCHPDVVSMNQKHNSTNNFIKIQAAYSTLSDPNKRASYDRQLFRQPRSSSPYTFGGGRRSWETDQCW